MKNILFFIILIAVVYTETVFTSCKKNGNTEAVITVVDTLGLPVANATVTLWQDTVHNLINNDRSVVRQSYLTDGSGEATFIFANEAFLNIDAVRTPSDTILAHVGHGFIRLQQYETVTARIILPY